MSRLFTAIVHKEDPLYVAECPEVGTASQGGVRSVNNQMVIAYWLVGREIT